MNSLIKSATYLVLGAAMLASCSSNNPRENSRGCVDFNTRLYRTANIERRDVNEIFIDQNWDCNSRKDIRYVKKTPSMEERSKDEYCEHYPDSQDNYYKRCR